MNGDNPIWVSWIPVNRIEVFLPVDLYAFLAALTLGGWLFYKVFLGTITTKRHASLRKRFVRLLIDLSASALLALSYWHVEWPRFSAYVGLFALISGAFSVIRIAQIYLYLFLFFGHLRQGVPRLIANLFTLVFGAIVFCFVGSYVFGIKLAPVLATSAVFSLILGIALQDTLGNLFSGLSLQFEKPFGIGDWVEVQNGGQKWSGQIQEINWRSTLLQGFMDELIAIPNRTMAQSQVLNFSAQKPPRQGRGFRLPFGTDIEAAKAALLETARTTPGVLESPAPSSLIIETGDSWIMLKVFYSIADYGTQWRVGDQIIARALPALAKAGAKLAVPEFKITQPDAR